MIIITISFVLFVNKLKKQISLFIIVLNILEHFNILEKRFKKNKMNFT